MNEAAVIGNNALVLDTKEEENKLGRQVSLIEQKAESVAVNSDEDFAYAGELTKQVKQMQTKVTDYWEPMRKSTYEAYKAVTDHKKEMLDPLAAAEKILKRKMGAYTMQKEKERREREDALRRKAEEEMNRKLEEAAKAESAGDAFGAEMAMTEAEVMENVATTAVIKPEAPVMKGVSTQKTWKITKIDSAIVPTHVQGVEIRPVDEKAILRLIKATKGAIQIPGITYEEDVTVSVRK